MHLAKLKLTNFRNFKSFTAEFDKGVNVIVGPNASGKTNILEGIFCLATGKSFKAKREMEMIKNDTEIARVWGEAKDDEITNLEIVLTDGQILMGQSTVKTPRKKLTVNGVPRRVVDFAGNLKTVLFGPWDMDLLTGSPSNRRRYLDQVLFQLDREYRRAVMAYEKGVRQRNRVLWKIREGQATRNQLTFWNELLVKNGDYIGSQRETLIAFINSYKSPNEVEYQVVYDKSGISQARLAQYDTKEVAAATTLVGPHRDDFKIQCIVQSTKRTEKDLATYGSRGEQRMGILWLKLAEIAFVEARSHQKPLLLLDDIFSELDHEHRSVVAANLAGFQSIITTADKHYLSEIDIAHKIVL